MYNDNTRIVPEEKPEYIFNREERERKIWCDGNGLIYPERSYHDVN